MERIEAVKNYVQKRLEGNSNGHGMDHILRVYHNVLQLLAHFPEANRELCIIAALVHDLIDDKVAAHPEQEKTALAERFKRLGFSSDFSENVMFIIDNMSFRKGQKLTTIEGQIVQDADRLDALGAIGISRTIMYGGAHGRTLYKEGDRSNDTCIGHFHEKLYTLESSFNTESARKIAKKRTAFMREFEAKLIAEIEGRQ